MLLPLVLATMFMNPTPVIIDTDMDLDDAMAILFTLRDSGSRVEAITVCGNGFTQPQYGVVNAMRLTQLAGVPKLPVAFGSDRSLSPVADFPQEWRVSGDQFFVDNLPANPNSPSPLRAADLIVQKLRASRQPIDILALAPLTNVAMAIHKDPSIVSKIGVIYVSGGAVDAAGNVFGEAQGAAHPNSEWNVFLDAVAASNVLNSGARIVLVPTDATDKLPLYKSATDRLTRKATDPVHRFIVEDVNEFYATVKDTPRYWDPAAAVLMAQDYGAAVIRHDSFAKKPEKIRLSVNLEPGTNYGRTQRNSSGALVEVVLDADLTLFEKTFYGILNR
jgi:inosine-uridine nucleoside N-ribohydrolase